MPNATTTTASNTVSKYTYSQCIKISPVSFYITFYRRNNKSDSYVIAENYADSENCADSADSQN